MTSSRTRVVDGATAVRNAGTRVMGALDVAARLRADAVGVVELRALWQDALDRVERWRAEHPEGAAMALIVRHGRALDVTLHQVVDEPVAVVIGRHSECDVELQTSHASLRHAAIVAWPDRVVAIDLRSELGLRVSRFAEDREVTNDGRVARRLSSTSALQFHAASAEVTALFAPHDAPFAVRWADQLEAQVSGALVDVDAPREDFAWWERSVVVRTCVAGLPRPVVREDQLGVACTRAAVERGVVLGRYTRCDRTTALAGDERVSRVHALVFAAHDALWVIDTGSSGGTSLVRSDGSAQHVGEGRRIARMPSDARLFLAGTEAVLVVEP